MFSWTRKKYTTDFQPYLRRLCDLTAFNQITATERRADNRYGRVLPTLITPWHQDHPKVAESVVGLTIGIADRGISVVLDQPLDTASVCIGFWLPSLNPMSDPWFFLGMVKHVHAVGGGFRTLGIELTEYANVSYMECLAPLKLLAKKLLPSEEDETDQLLKN